MYRLAVEIPTASITGTTAADRATDRADRLRIASRPFTRVRACTGHRQIASTSLVQNGPSSATPIAQHRTEGPAVEAASGPLITVAVTISNAIPPPSAIRPNSNRIQPNHLRCND